MDTITATVDAKGQSCPGPLVSLAKALKGAKAGDLFELLATDPGFEERRPQLGGAERERAAGVDRVRRRLPLRRQEAVSGVATTETDLSSELQLADLLRRVEVLEEADGKRIEKKNKLDDHRVGR